MYPVGGGLGPPQGESVYNQHYQSIHPKALLKIYITSFILRIRSVMISTSGFMIYCPRSNGDKHYYCHIKTVICPSYCDMPLNCDTVA